VPRKSFTPLFVSALVLISFVLAAGCSKKSTNSNPPSPAANQVDIHDFYFQPDSLAVDSGTTVTWTNRGSVSHTVTSDSSGYFGSSQLSPSHTFSFAFPNKGTFHYHCSIHSSMHGKVVVK
jgi:plastocyanin